MKTNCYYRLKSLYGSTYGCLVMRTINLSVSKAITTINKFKKALCDTDKSQFIKAISAIDKLSPIHFSDKCCSKFSMCLTKFFLVSQIAKVFF